MADPIAALATAPAIGLLVLVDILAPGEPWLALAWLCFVVALEGATTTAWLNNADSRGVDRLAYRAAEVFLLLVLARMLATDADLFMLDEPGAGLSSRYIDQVGEALCKMVTLGKKGTLAARRQAIATLRLEKAVQELFSAVAPAMSKMISAGGRPSSAASRTCRSRPKRGRRSLSG